MLRIEAAEARTGEPKGVEAGGVLYKGRGRVHRVTTGRRHGVRERVLAYGAASRADALTQIRYTRYC
jgi:hypothetical protein